MGVFLVIVLILGLAFVIHDQNKRAKENAEMAEREARESAQRIAEAKKALVDRIQLIAQTHIKTLALKWDQTISQDEYGNYLLDRWSQALDYFVDNVLRKDSLIVDYLLPPHIAHTRTALNDPSFMEDELNQRLHEVKTMIVDAVVDYKTKQLESESHLNVDIDSLDPVQFEHYCAELLRREGWDARVTQASGDQGIDVIATFCNVKVVFQCKKYSQPVGNAAVQEIIAGKAFEQAHVAAVVSNATFTPSAKQLATTTGVHLLHFSELQDFARQLGLAG